MARKPRSDSKLKHLDLEIENQLFDMLTHLGYSKALVLAKKELKISTSTGALHDFWEWKSAKESENRILKAVTSADSIIDAAADSLPKIDQAMEAALKQAAFEAALSGDNDTIKTLVELTLKVGKASMDERALSLQIDRFEFDAAKAALTHVSALKAIQNDKGMSETEKVDAVRRQLFSVLPEESDG